MGKVLLTGTRAYGPVSENSDIDIVMLKADALRLLGKLKNRCIYYTQEEDYGDTSSFKFSLLDELPLFNIIVAEDETFYFMWEYATDKMKELAPIHDREQRIELCHTFQDQGFEIAMQENGRKFYEEYKKTHGVQPFNLETGPPKVNSFNNPFNNFGGVDDMWK